MVIIVNINIHC